VTVTRSAKVTVTLDLYTCQGFDRTAQIIQTYGPGLDGVKDPRRAATYN